MRVDATGPGRRGTLDQGVGKLILRSEAKLETKQLLALLNEIHDDNFGFWTPLMWAAQNGKLKKSELKMLAKVIERIKSEVETVFSS